MNVRDKKGSITIFVLVGLLFMAGFLIISFGSNINKSKSVKEQLDIVKSIYSHGDGDEKAYERAYTALRKKNRAELEASVEYSSGIELTKTFEDTLSNYKIYGASIQNTSLSRAALTEIKSVGDLITTSTDENYGKYVIPVKISGKNVVSRVDVTKEGAGKTVAFEYSYPNTKSGTYTFSSYVEVNGYNGNGSMLAYGYRTANGGNKMTYGTFLTYSKYTGPKRYSFNFTVEDGDTLTFFYVYLPAACKEGTIVTLKNQMLALDNADITYEPYKEVTTNIYLNEPLRKIGDSVDYIDFENKKLIRNVEVIDNTGTLTLEESLNGLITSKEEVIDLPALPTYEDYTKIEVLTETVPSKVEVKYKGYTME